MNRRLFSAAFRKFQEILRYKAFSEGILVIDVDPAYTSSICPICGNKLSEKDYHLKVCKNCGLVADRDAIAAHNIRKRAYEVIGYSLDHTPKFEVMTLDVGSFRPECPPMNPEEGMKLSNAGLVKN